MSSALNTQLYPLRFTPYFKEKLWGGQKLRTVLGKDFGNLANCGETWEVSGVAGHVSKVANGPLAGESLTDLISQYKGQLVGGQVFERFGTDFPLLVKFIDANDDLSIQVHPDDVLAKKRHDSFGKTEMWYIMDADPGSTLISGFNQEVNREMYESKFNSGKLMDILNREVAETDDVFFLPAGRVHTIGKGLLLAEIQQTSDITYRIYDFDRVGTDGKKRELHVEQALDAIDYAFYDDYKTKYTKLSNEPVEVAACPYFVTNRLSFDQEITRTYDHIDSFVVYVCVAGSLELSWTGGSMTIQKGEAILLPAAIKATTLSPQGQFTLLEAYVPTPTQ